jgi:hypothetical protein
MIKYNDKKTSYCTDAVGNERTNTNVFGKTQH